MGNDTLLTLMTVFVAVCAVAMLIQVGLLFGIYMASKRMADQVSGFAPRIEAILSTAQTTLEQSKDHIINVTAKANDIMDATRVQLQKVDEFLTDTSARARVQLDRAELVLDDTANRVQESVSLVHSGIVKPLREINGVANGIRTAMQHLLTGKRPHVNQATQDEEMFI